MIRYAGVIFLCFVSSLFGSAVTLLVAGETGGDEAAAPERTIIAREVVLEDEAGNVRVRLRGDAEDEDKAPGQVVIYDAHGAARMWAGVSDAGNPEMTLANSDRPNPDHKRIRLAVDASMAQIEMGHGDLDEIALRSARPSDTPANAIRLHARNGSEAAFYVDAYGHATAEVKDAATETIFRVPEWRPVLPE